MLQQNSSGHIYTLIRKGRPTGHPATLFHYCDAVIGAVASQITSLTIVYSTVYSDADQRKHQSSASLAFVRGIHRGPVNSPHKWPVTWKMFPFDDVIIHVSVRRHITRWPKMLKPRHTCLFFSNRSEIWQALRQRIEWAYDLAKKQCIPFVAISAPTITELQ